MGGQAAVSVSPCVFEGRGTKSWGGGGGAGSRACVRGRGGRPLCQYVHVWVAKHYVFVCACLHVCGGRGGVQALVVGGAGSKPLCRAYSPPAPTTVA